MVRLTIQTYHLCNSFSFVSLLLGGLICVAVQLLMDNTKLLPGRIMVILVCLGAVLGAVLGTAVPLLAADAAGDAEELSPFAAALISFCIF